MGQRIIKTKREELQTLTGDFQNEALGKEAVLQPIKGSLFGGARIHYGDIHSAYILHRQILGTGYFGYVRRITDRKTGIQRAVKIIDRSTAQNDQIRLLRNEIQVCLRLSHPHVIRLVEVWENSNFFYLVTELCSGPQLYEKLSKISRFTEAEAKTVVRQMLLALSYLKTHNIVHRDLRIDTWLYDSSSNTSLLKLIGFNYARIWFPDSKRKMYATCGTMSYCSPEKLLGNYTNSCDMWSLGVIVFLLLTGSPPFRGSETEMLDQIIQARYSLNDPRSKKLSAEAKDFILLLLEKDPSKRLTPLEALRHPWIEQEKVSPVLHPEIIEHLTTYCNQTKFKRIVLFLLTFFLRTEQLQQPGLLFLACDKSNQGRLLVSDLEYLFLKQKNDFTKSVDVQKLFKTLDLLKLREILFHDFVAGTLSYFVAINEDLLYRVFQELDFDHSGFISFEDLRQVFGYEYSLKATACIFSEADVHKTGMVYFDEFLQLFMDEKSFVLSEDNFSDFVLSRRSII